MKIKIINVLSILDFWITDFSRQHRCVNTNKSVITQGELSGGISNTVKFCRTSGTKIGIMFIVRKCLLFIIIITITFIFQQIKHH